MEYNNLINLLSKTFQMLSGLTYDNNKSHLRGFVAAPSPVIVYEKNAFWASERRLMNTGVTIPRAATEQISRTAQLCVNVQ